MPFRHSFRSVSKNTFEQSNPKIAITRIIYHQLIYPLDAGNFEDWTHLEDTNKTKLLSCLAIVVQYHVKFLHEHGGYYDSSLHNEMHTLLRTIDEVLKDLLLLPMT